MPERSSRFRTFERASGWCEYRFVLLFGSLALAITSVPYVIGAMMATDERVFSGFVYGISDCYSYVAKMRQGADGAWLFHIPYTPESHPGSLFYAFYLLLGKVAALLPGSDLTPKLIWGYHAARWLFGLGMLATTYRFLATLTDRVKVRRLAWLLVTFGGGLGWVLVALGASDWLGSLPLDFVLPEGFGFLVLFALPHLALARTLLLAGLLGILSVWRTDDPDTARFPRPGRSTTVRPVWWGAPFAGLCWLLMGFVVPFYVAVAWVVVGSAWIVLSLRERRLCWSEARAAAVAALISAPMVAYSAWRFTSDPVYAAWAAQNQALSPHPLHYLAAYGVPLACALFAIREAWTSDRPAYLALAWVAVVPALIYLPVNLQRRLVEGVQVPLSLLAAIGLTRIVDSAPRERQLRSRLLIGIVLLSVLPTNALVLAGSTIQLHGHPHPIFRHAEEVAALEWLEPRLSPSEVVLGSYETGNYLPVHAGGRAFLGHGPETVNADQKRVDVARFFDAATEDDWRRDLLQRYDVDYVFWGPVERDLGEFDPGTASYLRRVHEAGAHVVFLVEL